MRTAKSLSTGKQLRSGDDGSMVLRDAPYYYYISWERKIERDEIKGFFMQAGHSKSNNA